MNKQLRLRKEVFIIGGALTIVGWLIAWSTPDSISASPSVVYQWGMLNIIAGVISLLGTVIILIAGLVPLVSKLARVSKCLSCGIAVPESTDLFADLVVHRLPSDYVSARHQVIAWIKLR